MSGPSARGTEGRSIFHVEVHGTTFLFRGRPHVLGVLRDVSNEVQARKLLEQRVAERTHELASLLSLANQAAATRELSQLVAVVLPEVERMLACSWPGVYLADDGAPGARRQPRRCFGAAPCASSGELGLPVGGEMAVGQADLETLFPQGVSASCSLVVPLAASGATIGVPCLARPKGQPFGGRKRESEASSELEWGRPGRLSRSRQPIAMRAGVCRCEVMAIAPTDPEDAALRWFAG
jgi:hypothetical protein